MRTYIIILFAVLFFPIVAIAQRVSQPRQLLHGRVAADSLVVDNLSVSNTTSRIGAVTDDKGMFTIYARPTDTLLFSSVTFRSMYMVLKEGDFLQDPLVIKLDVNVTVLDEVVITPNVLSGDLAKDSKKTKTLSVTAGLQSAQELNRYAVSPNKYDIKVNNTLPPNMQDMNGINITRIFDMYFKKKNKRKDRGEIYDAESKKPFPEAIKERYTYYFFTSTLQIPQNEIGLFLNFSDAGETSYALLDVKKEFELTDYLVQKSKEYLANKK
jgi:hypothetical protein